MLYPLPHTSSVLPGGSPVGGQPLDGCRLQPGVAIPSSSAPPTLALPGTETSYKNKEGPLLSGKCLEGSCHHSATPGSLAGDLVTSFLSALLTVPSSHGKGTGPDAGGVCRPQASLAVLAL